MIKTPAKAQSSPQNITAADGRTVLLIDLQNHLSGRSAQTSKSTLELNDAMATLLRFAQQLAYPTPLTVRRAYTPAQQTEVTSSGAGITEALSRQAIEAVPAFTHDASAPREDTCMQLALDAITLGASSDVNHVIIASDNPRLIPLLSKLRDAHVKTTLISTHPDSSASLEPHCDRMVQFETMQNEERRNGPWCNPHILRLTREATHHALTQNADHTLPLNLLSKLVAGRLQSEGLQSVVGSPDELQPILTEYAPAFDISINDGTASSLITAPVRAVAPKTTCRESSPANETRSTPPTHSVEHYAYLLRSRQPKLYRIPMDIFEPLCDAAWQIIHPNGTRAIFRHDDLESAIANTLQTLTITGHTPRPHALLFQMYKSGCFICTEEGPSLGLRDFHWSLPARLADDISDYAHFRQRILLMITDLLAERLEQVDQAEIDVDVFVKFLYDGQPDDAQMAHAQSLLDLVYE